jgi:putative transposase
MATTQELSLLVGTRRACRSVGLSRASLYRERCQKGGQRGEGRASATSECLLAESDTRSEPGPLTPFDGDVPVPAQLGPDPGRRALSQQERQTVLDTLHAERFVDLSPAEVYCSLLDEGSYLCSMRTMYRLLSQHSEVRERRNQLRHPAYKKPELLATGANQVWSWDITKLLGPAKWSYYYLYVILDIFSRYVVGWMVAGRESASLAQRLIGSTCAKQQIGQGQLTVHADRGSSMQSRPVALLLADLGVAKSHSRPHVSNDNPYSEAQFKTMKYHPEFPGRFGCIEDARCFCQRFFGWYNDEHHHSGIAHLTPRVMHYGLATEVVQRRQSVLEAAYQAHPERFLNGPPSHPALPEAAWINQPSARALH